MDREESKEEEQPGVVVAPRDNSREAQRARALAWSQSTLPNMRPARVFMPYNEVTHRSERDLSRIANERINSNQRMRDMALHPNQYPDSRGENEMNNETQNRLQLTTISSRLLAGNTLTDEEQATLNRLLTFSDYRMLFENLMRPHDQPPPRGGGGVKFKKSRKIKKRSTNKKRSNNKKRSTNKKRKTIRRR
jgi:hypothetical protein